MSYPPEYYANRVLELEGELFQMRKDREELIRIINQWQEVCAGALQSGRNFQALADRASTVAEKAIAALHKSQQEVADWQRKEISKASCCMANEELAKAASAVLDSAHYETDDSIKVRLIADYELWKVYRKVRNGGS